MISRGLNFHNIKCTYNINDHFKGRLSLGFKTIETFELLRQTRCPQQASWCLYSIPFVLFVVGNLNKPHVGKATSKSVLPENTFSIFTTLIPVQANQRHITFFTPTMQRTGSELVLWWLLPFVPDTFKVKVVSKFKGSLWSALPKNYSPVYLHRQRPQGLFLKAVARLKDIFVTPLVLYSCRHSVWYINTIVLPDYLEYAQKHHLHTMLHVHEMEHMFSLLNEDQLQRAIHYPDLVIANSMHTYQLMERYGRKKPIELCYPAMDTSRIVAQPDIKRAYRQLLNIPETAFVWAMCGTLDENKNPALFVDIAYQLTEMKPQSFFLWIGGTRDLDFKEDCKAKAARKGVSDKIIWIDEPGENYINYFNCADGFILTSHKESFSLVTLEALLLGLPVVTHDCGGVTEILKEDIGTIVAEKNNASQFAEAMSNYMDTPYKDQVQRGIERAREFDQIIWGKKWNAILNNYIF